MGNRIFQQARQAVEDAQEAVQNTTTPLQQEEAVEKIKRAKQALSQAFADSSLAERDQLMEMQQTLYEFADDYLNEEL